METNNYIVYVQTDITNRITSINSSAFLQDTTDWIQIDEGLGDKYHHAQGNYLPLGLMDSNGCYNYALVDGVVTERTDADKQAEIDAIAKRSRMAEIITELSATDYKAIKFAEGLYTEEQYAPTRQARMDLRAEYNLLESELA